jgi:heat shock protein HslJ
MNPLRLALLLPLAWTALFASGCGAATEESRASATKAPAGAKAVAPTLYGRWRIVAVNGSPPLTFGGEAEHPSLVFSPSRFGGSTGCNSFGGTGLLVGERWFGEPPMATQQGCGALTAQESAIMGIAAGGPSISFAGADEAELRSPLGLIRLRREAPDEPAPAERHPMLLAGSAWELRAVDGSPPDSSRPPERRVLRFEEDRWTLNGACRPLSGRWRQQGADLRMEIDAASAGRCAPEATATDRRLRSAIAGLRNYVVGPNRELVIGGAGHWLVGQFDAAALKEDKALLVGEWRVESVDGQKPMQSPRPPSLIFGNSSFAFWDGCNHSEGIQIVLSRQLFTRGSGASTLASCPADPLRSRIGSVLGSNPRIAKTKEGSLSLVAATGTLHLSRMSARRFGTREQLGLRAPATIELLKPRGRLMLLASNRFAIMLDCGRIEGEWRGGQPARFSPGPAERTAPACDSRPGSDAFRVGQFFTGNVHAVTGPNRDIVLLVNENESIAGRIGD